MKTLNQKLAGLKNSNPISVRLFEKLCHPVSFKKGERLSTSSYPVGKIYYIETGLVQGIFIDRLDEITACLVTEGFIIPYLLFTRQVSSIEYIQFLEGTKGWSVNLAQHVDLSNQLLLMLLEIYEESMNAGYEREKIIRIKHAADRYIYFMKSHQDLKNKISTKVMASYLNIHPKHLSVIRKKN
jgi:hypothetical protein